MILAEGREDGVRFVDEIDDVGGVFLAVVVAEGPVEARQGLHRLDAAQLAIDIHGAEQRLVEAGLELVGDDEDAEFRRVERLPDIAPAQGRVHGGLGEILRSALAVGHLAGKGHDQGDRIALALDVGGHCQHPAHRLLAA